MVGDFEEVARAHCTFIDASSSYDRAELVERLEEHIAALYAAALSLPSGDPADEDAQRLPTDDWTSLFKRLRAQLGDVSEYWHVFDPFKEEGPSLGDLADDAADIYADLMRGLVFVEAGNHAAPEAIRGASVTPKHADRRIAACDEEARVSVVVVAIGA